MTPFHEIKDAASLYVGDCREVLAGLPAGAARTCVTSPPYWGLRDYGVPGQLGNESTPDEYVVNLVAVFREVRRVLAEDGTLWLNLGDSYSNIGKWGGSSSGKHARALHGAHQTSSRVHGGKIEGLKPKDLVGIPWMTAFALRADGWWLRSDVVWSKPNPMPESVTDRPTKAHEYVFLLTKAERYFYDADAIREEHTSRPQRRLTERKPSQRSGGVAPAQTYSTCSVRDEPAVDGHPLGRNARTVWSIATQPSGVEHFATMPPELARRCILAGSAPGDTVLDPFNGAGTTGMVAMQHGRKYLGVDLNPGYAEITAKRWASECGQRLLGLG